MVWINSPTNNRFRQFQLANASTPAFKNQPKTTQEYIVIVNSKTMGEFRNNGNDQLIKFASKIVANTVATKRFPNALEIR